MSWQDVMDILKKAGMSRSTMRVRRNAARYQGSEANQYPKGHRAKRKRKQKLQKESRRRNRS